MCLHGNGYSENSQYHNTNPDQWNGVKKWNNLKKLTAMFQYRNKFKKIQNHDTNQDQRNEIKKQQNLKCKSNVFIVEIFQKRDSK
jgi:hypothetical protein